MLRMRAVIIHIAITDTLARYRRTLLGPFWIVIGLALGSLGLGLLWSELWNIPKSEIVPSITIGFLVWIFMSNSIIEGTNCLIIEANMVQNMRLPLMFFPLVSLAKQVINFLHSLLIVFFVSLVFPPENVVNLLWIIPSALICFSFLLFTMSSLSILCARFRDIVPLVGSTLPLLFFLSPVLFRIQQAENISWLIWMNPFTYFIIILREPLQGAAPSFLALLIASVITIVTFIFLAFLLHKKRNQVVYWV